AIAVQRDGKIIVAGVTGDFRIAVVRYLVDGSTDVSFGTNGSVIYAHDSEADALALQPDGKIIVAGGDGSNFMIVRFNTDGSTDSSFGNSGEVFTDFSSGLDVAAAMVYDQDSKITVVGSTNNGSSYDFALARYSACLFCDDFNNGVLDPLWTYTNIAAWSETG